MVYEQALATVVVATPFIFGISKWVDHKLTKNANKILTQNTSEHESNRALLMDVAGGVIRIEGKVDRVESRVEMLERLKTEASDREVRDTLHFG